MLNYLSASSFCINYMRIIFDRLFCNGIVLQITAGVFVIQASIEAPSWYEEHFTFFT